MKQSIKAVFTFAFCSRLTNPKTRSSSRISKSGLRCAQLLTFAFCLLTFALTHAQTSTINGNQYAFQYSGTADTIPKTGFGLYFNQNNPAPAQYEFLNSGGAPIFSIGAVSGHTRVEGALNMGGNINMDAGTALRVRGNEYAFQYFDNANYGLIFSSSNSAYQFTNSSGNPIFSLGANTGDVQFNGKVNIGTQVYSHLDYILTVDGHALFTEATVKLRNNWPDFVFQKGYCLPELQDLEAYIKANQHLPEIPSAKKVESEGIELGEMNRLLLQKVEELTLYVIEQDKRIRELEQTRNTD